MTSAFTVSVLIASLTFLVALTFRRLPAPGAPVPGAAAVPAGPVPVQEKPVQEKTVQEGSTPLS